MPERPGPDECDLVMKGGITSGVIYPSTVLELAGRYRFRNVGGTSVGAIAAAVTAAAEYGRQTGKGTGFDQLRRINEETRNEGFLVSLFKPRHNARGLHAIYLRAIRRRGLLRTATTILREALWVVIPLLAWWGTLAVTASWLADRWWLVPVLLGGWATFTWLVVWIHRRRFSWGGVLGGLLLPALWPLLIALPSMAIHGWRDLSQHGFGLVPGASPHRDALCDWLHRHIQEAAGLDDDQPLTFGMLRDDRALDKESVGVDLQMITSNLSTARPMRLPDELEGYAFDPDDLEGVLPTPVIDWLLLRGTHEGGLVRLPGKEDLPVLLGFRMSLSFPLLFTALRLYAPAPGTAGGYEPVTHWFSDGGIGSNFPVHFFDAWVPRRPTFALSFAPFPTDRDGKRLLGENEVGLPPPPNGPRLPRWVNVKDLGGFFAQVAETMQNWRDTLQSELPGFRDRIYEARLDKRAGEGGLNLGMDTETIKRLQKRGSRVGQSILDTFDWDQHFFTRYLVTMQQMEQGLLGWQVHGTPRVHRGVKDALAERRDEFADGDVGAGELFDRDSAWLRSAGAATWALVEQAESWGSFGRFVGDAPRPHPVMRVVPDV